MTTKESIFKEALDLFALKGYDVTTIRVIGKKVGITESSFYNHYSSKKDLFDAILKSCDDFFHNENLPIDKLDIWIEKYSMRELLYIYLNRYLKMWNKPQAIQKWQILNNEQYRNQEARNIVLKEAKRRVDRTIVLFEKLQKQGKMKPNNTLHIASLYVNAVRTIHCDHILSRLHHADEQPYIDAMRETIDTFVDLYQLEK